MRRWLVGGLFGAALALAAATADAARIQIVTSYHEGYQWEDEWFAGLRAGLGAEHEVAVDRLDAKRQTPEAYQPRAAAVLDRVTKARPDVAVLGDDIAMRLLGPGLSAAGIPVVFLGVNNNPRTYFGGGPIPANVTGVIERPVMLRSLALIRQLIPTARRVLILFDDSETSDALIAEALQGRSEGEVAGVGYACVRTNVWSQWRRALLDSRRNGFDAVIFAGYQTTRDDDGRHVPIEDAVEWASANSPLPPFGSWRFSLGPTKTIGGVLVSGELQGRTAADLVRRVLARKGTPAIVKGDQGELAFSRRQLDKWNIRLPSELAGKAEIGD